MELNQQDLSNVWWKGALTGAAKGIVQGLLLGALAGLALYAGVAALGAAGFVGAANGLAGAFGSFIYAGSSATGFTFATAFNPTVIIIFNTVLTSIGNFITGGASAVDAYKQDANQRMNEARISQIESREMALEQTIASPSRSLQKIIAAGPRNATSFRDAQEQREQTSMTPTIH